ncbi:MAG: FAD-binding protein [Helicobacteraceae bacterium]|nr:FAD-binding protein [Helicobacteraceae bacterium]
MPLPQIDVLIIGSGAAALSAAFFLPANIRVALVSKPRRLGCNTEFAQGGIACAIDENDIESHIADTLKAGAGRCDAEAAKILATKGFSLMKTLADMGAPLDRDENGAPLRAREAAHSKPRVLRAGGDQTGAIIGEFLLERVNHPICFGEIVDLLIDGGRCYGATIDEDGKRENIYAHNVVIASGGFGALYDVTTNPPAILGELQGIAALRGRKLSDMHFTQFHPTALDMDGAAQKPLLSEALRGEGAKIVDENNRRFLEDYGENELSPRDRLSRAIFAHIESSGRAYLDLSGFDSRYFAARFPVANRQLTLFGLKPPFRKAPIAPAFHYAMGGIAVDKNARVLGLRGLYAIGEAACTGAHGANRLASNSLLEALVFGKIAADTIANDPNANPAKTFGVLDEPRLGKDDDEVLSTIKKTLGRRAGVIRERASLKQAAAILDALTDREIGLLTRRSLRTAQAIVESAIEAEESVGAHYVKEESL